MGEKLVITFLNWCLQCWPVMHFYTF